jgi:polyhydroxyalkanoate synthesis regulator phasin
MSMDKYLETAMPLIEMTRKRAEQIAKTMVKQGEIAAEKTEKAVEDLLKRSEANRKAVAAIVKAETEKAVGRLGVARQAEVNRLKREVASLQKKLDAATGKGAVKAPAKKSAAKKSAAKKSSAAKRSAKKSAGKKSAAKKSTSAKKTAAKKTAQAAKKSAPPAAGGSSS